MYEQKVFKVGGDDLTAMKKMQEIQAYIAQGWSVALVVEGSGRTLVLLHRKSPPWWKRFFFRKRPEPLRAQKATLVHRV